MDVAFCLAALDRFGKPEIFNTDQGSQFTSGEVIGSPEAPFEISVDLSPGGLGDLGGGSSTAPTKRYFLRYEDGPSDRLS